MGNCRGTTSQRLPYLFAKPSFSNVKGIKIVHPALPEDPALSKIRTNITFHLKGFGAAKGMLLVVPSVEERNPPKSGQMLVNELTRGAMTLANPLPLLLKLFLRSHLTELVENKRKRDICNLIPIEFCD